MKYFAGKSHYTKLYHECPATVENITIYPYVRTYVRTVDSGLLTVDLYFCVAR